MTVINKDFIVNNGLQISGYITKIGGSAPTNGQLLIGDATNGRWSIGSLTASNGAVITPTAGSIAVSTNATSANTASTIVSRDTNGAFTAGIITGVAAQKAFIASNGSGTGQTSIALTRVGAATDNKTWEFLAASTGSLVVRTVNDAYTSSTNALVFNRDSAYGVPTAQIIPAGGRLSISTATDDGTNTVQINGPLNGYGLAVYRSSNSSQYIGLASSPTTTNNANVIDSYSAANNAKNIVINSTTDSSNTAPTAGSLGIQFAIQGVAKASLSQGGHFTVGTVTDDGVNMLQVSGTMVGSNTSNGNAGVTFNGLSGFSAGMIMNNTTSSTGRKYSIYSNTAGNLVLGDETVSAARISVTPSGRVLMGISSDDGVNQLQVNGTILATTPAAGSNNTQVATTAFVNNLAGDYQSWTYLTGATTLLAANSGSIYFCGSTGGYTVTLPAPTTANLNFTITNVSTDSTTITISTPSASIYNQTAATSTFVLGVGATIKILSDGSNWTILEHYTKSPNFIGTPTAPTAAAGTNTTQLATTAFVATSFAPINNPTFTGRVYIPEGTAALPGLSFVNDGAIDTGFYHISDGVFAVTCNTVPQVQFSNTAGTSFLTGITVSSGTINGTSVGATTPSTGQFTSLVTTGTTSLGGRLLRQTVTVSAAGTTQATATATSADVVYVNGGTAGTATGVQLPTGANGASCYVINNSGISITLYPVSGGTIDWNAANAGITMANQTKLQFVCVGTTTWFSMGATYA